MTLRISDDPRRGAGHALLDLGLDPGQDMLNISVLNLLRSGGEYLGPSSITKTNWVKQPYYFAARRAPEAGTAIFSIGPEVCNYLPPGTFVEIGSQDNLFAAEQVEWPGITARSDFAGALMGDLPNRANPLPAFAPAPAVGIRSQKDPKQEIERIAETPKTLASAAHLEQSLPLPAAAPAAVPLPPAPIPSPPPPSAMPKGWRWAFAIIFLLVIAGAIAFWHPWKRQVDDAEMETFTRATACVASDACGARACVTPYRTAYPAGKHITDILALEQEAGVTCERNAFDHAVACASPLDANRDYCHIGACFSDYQAHFPTGQYSSVARQRIADAGLACDKAKEQALFDTAAECARRRPCTAESCFSDYKRVYPNGTFRTQLDMEARKASSACLTLQPPEPPPPQAVAPTPQPDPVPATVEPPTPGSPSTPPPRVHHRAPSRPAANSHHRTPSGGGCVPIGGASFC